MEKAKEVAHKITHPVSSSGTAKGGEHEQQPVKPSLERDVEPKPTKVHLPVAGTEEKCLYSPSEKLRGKRALITGGDSGIGRAVAILFAMEGARVAIAYLPAEEEDAKHTREQIEKNGGQAILLPGDVSTARHCREIVDRAASELGGIDILVNNAAYREEKADIADITDEQWYTTFRTNIDASFHITKAALPHIPAGGSIINSTSVDAYIGVPTRVDYAASKGAIVAFTRALSNQLVKRGIRVNAVAAGPTWTPMLAAATGGTRRRLQRREARTGLVIIRLWTGWVSRARWRRAMCFLRVVIRSL